MGRERLMAALGQIDQRMKSHWDKVETGARVGASGRYRDIIANQRMAPERTAEMIVGRTPSMIERERRAPVAEGATVRKAEVARVMSGLQANPAMVADQYAPGMNRGPLGGERGVIESTAVAMNNPYVRRGGLIAAGAGAAVGTGALLTEGAQQLLQLMDFLQHGEEVQARAASSPLT
jgi:hypothetical protein